MKPPFPTHALLFALLMCAAKTSAADAGIAESPPAPLGPLDTVPARPRATSPAMAEKIAATVPKFVSPEILAARNSSPPLDLRELDKPKNNIVRLPNYIVREPKPPTFPERELLIPQGKLDLAYKRHPGLRVGSLPFFSNDGIALFMLEEEHRLERLHEANDLLDLLRLGHDPSQRKAEAQVRETFIRKD